MVLLEGLVVKTMAPEREEVMSCIVSLAATCSGTSPSTPPGSCHFWSHSTCFGGVEHKLILHSCTPYYVNLGSLLGLLLQLYIKKYLTFSCGLEQIQGCMAALRHIFQEQHWGVGEKSWSELVSSSLLVADPEQAVNKTALLRHSLWAGRKTCEHENKARMVGKK